MRPHVHARRIEVAEPRRICLVLAVDEIHRRADKLLVHRLHALGVERAGIFDHLLADAPVGRIDGRIVGIAGLAFENAARSELGPELRVLGVVRILRLFLGVEMVEIAEELVEAMHGRQILVAVAEMVLAELPGGVAERLQGFRDTHVFGVKPDVRAGQADLGQAGPDRRLSGDERCASGGATLLAVPVGEQRAFLGDAVDVGRAVAHDAQIVGADIEPADVVGHDHEDVRLAAGRSRRASRRGLLRLRERAGCHRRGRHQRRRAEQDIAAVGRVALRVSSNALGVGLAPWCRRAFSAPSSHED